MTTETFLRAQDVLPSDAKQAVLVGRVWRPDQGGPSVVTVRDGQVIDITKAAAPTISALLEITDPVAWVCNQIGEVSGSADDILSNSVEATRKQDRPYLLAPIDLQAIKAAGVTFIASLLERVIEEHARGSSDKGAEIRADFKKVVGTELAAIKPGSETAREMKKLLIERGLWSQYLEVGIGPDAEVFTKGQPMSAVGSGARVGIRPDSIWNNPEPEIALMVSSKGRITGATLGNDVNLRDFEGRSALLLSRAKDNNASCGIGPFIRLFDSHFSLDDVREAEVDLRIEGTDGFVLNGTSSMSEISHDVAELVRATLDKSHQYPDGFALLLGTTFVPVKDRETPGKGFTHKEDDVVTIFTPRIGKLRNSVKFCPDYLAAYVILHTSQLGLDGHGMTFTIGRGNEICVAAITALAPRVVGMELDWIKQDPGRFWRQLTSDSQLRWIGSEKGAIHMATGAIVNAVWGLWGKADDKPVWRLVSEMGPEELVKIIEFRYLSDCIVPEEALEMFQEAKCGKKSRTRTLLEQGYPCYSTSAGWLGYDDDKLRMLTKQAIDAGFKYLKFKVGHDIDDDIRRLKIACEIVGPDIRLMIDANQVWEVGQAADWLKRLAFADPWFIEEPTNPDDIEGHREIRAAVAPIRVHHSPEKLTPEQLQTEPDAGGLFRLRPGVAGLPKHWRVA